MLIFDEITSGWRHVFGGVHLKYGVEPDIAVFAKSIANAGAALDTLQARGLVRCEKRKTGGRDAEVWVAAAK